MSCDSCPPCGSTGRAGGISNIEPSPEVQEQSNSSIFYSILLILRNTDLSNCRSRNLSRGIGFADIAADACYVKIGAAGSGCTFGPGTAGNAGRRRHAAAAVRSLRCRRSRASIRAAVAAASFAAIGSAGRRRHAAAAGMPRSSSAAKYASFYEILTFQIVGRETCPGPSDHHYKPRTDVGHGGSHDIVPEMKHPVTIHCCHTV